MPGQKPVKKFTSRQAAVTRIWKTIQSLAPRRAPQAPHVAPNNKFGKRAHRAKGATARQGSKTAQVVELLKRPHGVTLKDLMAATEWQAHSVRGFISGALRKKMGFTVESTKSADAIVRTWHMVFSWSVAGARKKPGRSFRPQSRWALETWLSGALLRVWRLHQAPMRCAAARLH